MLVLARIIYALSSSDDFIQAQRLVRSASDEVLSAVGAGPSCQRDGTTVQREYFPSPLDSGESSPETDGVTRQLTGPSPSDAASSQDTLESSPTTEQSALIRPPKRYPEYKH